MEYLKYWPEIFAGLALVIGFSQVYREPSWVRVAFSFGLFLIITFMLYGSLGTARPLFLDFQEVSGILLDSYSIEGKDIYVYMLVTGDSVPESFVIPWTIEDADSLDKATEMGKKTNQTLLVTLTSKKKKKNNDETLFTQSDGGDSYSDGEMIGERLKIKLANNHANDSK